MIEVKFGEYSVEAKGHAQTAPEGEDLVCAAVSTVLWALFEGLSRLEGVEVKMDAPNPGNGHVTAKNVPREGDGMFIMAETALSHLAFTFPGAVHIAKPA